MHIGRIIFIAYSTRYSFFVLMCRKTHITHSLDYLSGLPNVSYSVGWLVVLGLTALCDNISVYIGPSPKEREKKKKG